MQKKKKKKHTKHKTKIIQGHGIGSSTSDYAAINVGQHNRNVVLIDPQRNGLSPDCF